MATSIVACDMSGPEVYIISFHPKALMMNYDSLISEKDSSNVYILNYFISHFESLVINCRRLLGM